MGLFSAIGSLMKPISKIAGPALAVGRMVPGLSTAIGVAGAATTAYTVGKSLFGSSSPSGGLPPLPAAGTTGGFGLPKGPGGALQLPWNDPSISGSLKPHSLDDQYLRVFYRAPKGYIVMWDGGMPHVGRPFCVEKKFARTLHYNDGSKVVKNHAKPPISVGEFHSLKRAHRTIKKVKKVHGLIAYVHDHTTSSGKVKVHHHKKGGHK